MKKLAIFGFALITAFLAACSDDSSSSSKEGVVSCTLKSKLDGKKIPYVCWQMPDAYKDSMENLCGKIGMNLDNREGVLGDEECESSNVQKECVNSDNYASILYIYDRTIARVSCNDIFSISDIPNEEENGEEGEDSEENEDYIPFAVYNVPEQRCVQFNALYQPKSDVSSVIGEVHQDPELTYGTGIYQLYKTCEDIVLKVPVATCSDGDEVNSVTVFFYDKTLAGKKCKDLVTFVPAAVEEGEPEEDEENAEAEEDAEAEEE